MDKIGANFLKSVKSIHDRLGVKAIPIQMNMGSENDFHGIIDLVTMTAYHFDSQQEEKYQEILIPAELKKQANQLRLEMLEEIVNYDETVMEKYLEGQEISVAEIKQCIRKGVLTAHFFPVLCGSAFKNKGVKLLLNAIVDYLPSPVDVPPIKGITAQGQEVTRNNDDAQPFAALAFKIATDPFVGRLTFIRVYAGVLKKGSYIYNSTKEIKERVSRLVKMHSNNREEIEEIRAGDICAVIGLKDTGTGNTLCDEQHEIILESMQFAEPVISLAIEPKAKSDQEKMSLSLSKLSEEDPTFRAHTDPETGQTIISGMGELHLEIIVDRLKREFKVAVNVGAPKVSFRETFHQTANVEGKYIKQTGGRGNYGHV